MPVFIGPPEFNPVIKLPAFNTGLQRQAVSGRRSQSCCDLARLFASVDSRAHSDALYRGIRTVTQ